ncbi:MAG TPA: type 4a pilus biogenesis protein PilO [Candidatus Paceibacterota bacterium]|nr:type 4a pilus biogenesis protein PilO [Candidatus Paceibacterota bacterium]
MRGLIVPIVLVVAAVGLFIGFTNPWYEGTKSIQTEVATYDDALNKSQQLRTIRDQKVAAFNTFSADEKSKLEDVLPDNVDNIHLIIDINNIAARHGLSLKDVQLGTISGSSGASTALTAGNAGDLVGSVTLGFAVNASYDDFLAFLQDLEHSLRIIDVEKIDFTADPKGGNNDYSMTIRTYWLH